jgi:hypothetical protein
MKTGVRPSFLYRGRSVLVIAISFGKPFFYKRRHLKLANDWRRLFKIFSSFLKISLEPTATLGCIIEIQNKTGGGEYGKRNIFDWRNF